MSPKVHKVKGMVTYVNAGPGFWAIVDDSGGKWRPKRMSKNLKQEGLRGAFELRELEEDVSIFMWGSPVKILSFVSEE
ncbi:MAG: hypothetical protein IPH04_09125 [Saprospirales bacterium]|mgnify:CR=1 FL=1|nr:hypothetical protein [Saprospirales bacterium]MBK6902955.1 hypothetical protein [Saprospirales bacterium]MBK7337779.1 hypothetical protein [Saprospirales bacterium]